MSAFCQRRNGFVAALLVGPAAALFGMPTVHPFNVSNRNIRSADRKRFVPA